MISDAGLACWPQVAYSCFKGIKKLGIFSVDLSAIVDLSVKSANVIADFTF